MLILNKELFILHNDLKHRFNIMEFLYLKVY